MTEATITISADEYFDLREKAIINTYLSSELAELKRRVEGLEHGLWEVEKAVQK